MITVKDIVPKNLSFFTASATRRKGQPWFCVEVAIDDKGVYVRDSKMNGPDDPVLFFSDAEWAAFLQGVKNSEFDLNQERIARAQELLKK